MSPEAAGARHAIANLLFRYVEIADRKDVDAVVGLLGRTRVRFPAGGSTGPDGAREFFARLWSAPEGHRHDVTNLIVDPTDETGVWRATAHYIGPVGAVPAHAGAVRTPRRRR